MLRIRGEKGPEFTRCVTKKVVFLLVMALLCAGFTCAADVVHVDENTGGMNMPGSPDSGPGGSGGTPDQAGIYIENGEENPEKEYEAGLYVDRVSEQDGMVLIRDLNMTSGNYTFNGIVASGESAVRIEKSTIRLGTDEAVTGEETGGAGVSADDGAMVWISDSELTVDGAARYVTANYNDAVLIVNNSVITSTGSNANTAAVAEPFSNEALLISGTARANFSIGATKTYYFNSVCDAEGWAALSTDSATGDGLDLFAYHTEGVAENGGYGTYADTNCRVWLYGSSLSAAEIGCIISKSGMISACSADQTPEDVMQWNEGQTVDAECRIVGGRNAVMIHAPDMMGQGLQAADCGTFTAENGWIGTSSDLRSTKNYYDYGDAVGAYIDYVSGAVFLIRSTSAAVNLRNVEMESYSGVLFQTVLNADSMGNFLAAGDGDLVEPIALCLDEMDVVGDVRHEDYQRRMTLSLHNTSLTGNIISGTMEEWNQQWAQYGEVNWVVDETYDTVYGVELSMDSGSVWNVTGVSTLGSMTVEEGTVINGTVMLDGEELTPEPGKTYSGEILVTGNYVPDEETEKTESKPQESAVIEEVLPQEQGDSGQEPEISDGDKAAQAPSEEQTHQSYAGVVAVGIIVLAAALVFGVLMIKKHREQEK